MNLSDSDNDTLIAACFDFIDIKDTNDSSDNEDYYDGNHHNGNLQDDSYSYHSMNNINQYFNSKPVGQNGSSGGLRAGLRRRAAVGETNDHSSSQESNSNESDNSDFDASDEDIFGTLSYNNSLNNQQQQQINNNHFKNGKRNQQQQQQQQQQQNNNNNNDNDQSSINLQQQQRHPNIVESMMAANKKLDLSSRGGKRNNNSKFGNKPAKSTPSKGSSDSSFAGVKILKRDSNMDSDQLNKLFSSSTPVVSTVQTTTTTPSSSTSSSSSKRERRSGGSSSNKKQQQKTNIKQKPIKEQSKQNQQTPQVGESKIDQQDREIQQRKRREEKLVGRLLGDTPIHFDLDSVTFTSTNTFVKGEIVLVPRSRGGFTYGKIHEVISSTMCHHDQSVHHPGVQYRAVYPSGSKKDNMFKDLSASYLGKLVSVDRLPEDVKSFSLTPPIENNGPLPRTIGQKASLKDLQNLVFSPSAKFHANQIALVPRSKGGFTYGCVLKECKVPCKVGNVKHEVHGYRVVVEKKQESTIIKDLIIGNIGKIFIMENMQQQQQGKQPANKQQQVDVKIENSPKQQQQQNKKVPNGNGNTSGKKDEKEKEKKKIVEEEEIDDEEEESDVDSADKDAEEEESEDDDVEEDEEDEEEEEILWNGESSAIESPTPAAAAAASSSPKSLSTTTTTTTSTPTSLAPPPVTNEKVILPSQLPEAGSRGVIGMPQDSIVFVGGNKKKKPYLVVIDGPNVAIKYSNKKNSLSVMGIKKALDYYIHRGYEAVAFVPESVVSRKSTGPGAPMKLLDFQPMIDNQQMLQELVEKRQVCITPPQDYDDSYAIKYAKQHNALIITNDRYNDHIGNQTTDAEKKRARKFIREHCISFTFVRQEFLPNPDFVVPS